MRRERIAAPLITLLLLVSVVGGAFAPAGVSGPVGTVEAQAADTEECSTWDAWMYDFFNTGHSGNEDNPCSAAYQVQQVTDEWNETDADQTRTQIHSQAGQLAASNEQFLTAQQNGLTNSETIAFSKGEAAAVEVLANNGTVSEAQEAANKSIEDYYTVKQMNLRDRWNVVAQTVLTLNNRSTNTTGVDSDFVTYGVEGSFKGDPSGDVDYSRIKPTSDTTEISSPESSTVTYVNGSSGTLDNLGYNLHSYEWVQGVANFRSLKMGGSRNPVGATEQVTDEGVISAASTDYYQIKVRPSGELSSKTIVDFREFRGSWKDIGDKSQSTKQEVSAYVHDSLGPAVQNGELDAQNYVSAATLAQEYAQDYNGSDGYTRAIAIAASSGMSTPDLDTTASMTISHDGSTHEGMLLSQNGPENESWESGATYDASLISGEQFFAVAGQNSTVIELDGAFTVESISGMDGNEIATAETQQVKYVVSNQSANYTALQEQVRDLNQQIEERKAKATSGGGSGDSSGNPLEALAQLLGISAGATVVVVVAGGILVVRIYTP